MDTKKKEETWQAPEYIHKEKTSEWYWSVGILTLAGVVSAYMFGNPLFASLILIIGFTMTLFGARQPKMISFGISDRGIRADNILYPFQTLWSFWILEKEHENLLLLTSRKKISTQIAIPLGDIDTEQMREFLLDYLAEEEDEESIAQRFMDYLGF